MTTTRWLERGRAEDARTVRGAEDERAVLALRREMCDVGHRMWTRGLCSGCEGNLSVRLDSDRVLCTPSGVSKGFLEPRSLRIVRLDGTPLGAVDEFAVTSEIRVHLAVYRMRPDVRAVVHSHAPHANAFAMAGIELPEGVYPEAEVVLGRTRRPARRNSRATSPRPSRCTPPRCSSPTTAR
jgi:ribulose-5-phosphate 4-epimerase/fuculose-1-phosphate aldolase